MHLLDWSQANIFKFRKTEIYGCRAPKVPAVFFLGATETVGLYANLTEIPPSAVNALPVTKDDCSDNRNNAAWAISAGSAIRFSGCKPAM